MDRIGLPRRQFLGQSGALIAGAAVLNSPLLTQAFAAQPGQEIIPWSPLLLLGREFQTRELFDEACQAAQFEPLIRLESRSPSRWLRSPRPGTVSRSFHLRLGSTHLGLLLRECLTAYGRSDRGPTQRGTVIVICPLTRAVSST